MSKVYYAPTIGALKKSIRDRKNLERKVKSLRTSLSESQEEYVNLLDAQKLLSTVSDDNTEAVLDFITGVINKTLSEIFKNDTRRIYLKKKLFAGSKPHIVVELVNADGISVDMEIQSGTGLRQVVSGLFTVCLVEIRKGRRLVIFDERFSGLHYQAARILSEIFEIFAEGGFQFIFVDYAIMPKGKVYNVEKIGTEAKVYSLGNIEYDPKKAYIFTENMDFDRDYIEDDDEDNSLVEERIIGG